jgi:hypothetical protein
MVILKKRERTPSTSKNTPLMEFRVAFLAPEIRDIERFASSSSFAGVKLHLPSRCRPPPHPRSAFDCLPDHRTASPSGKEASELLVLTCSKSAGDGRDGRDGQDGSMMDRTSWTR